MVQIYQAGNENFTQNGDAVLTCFSCEIKAKLNGTWALSLDVPIDPEGRWKLITENAVLKVPTWQDDEQLYRIYSYSKTESGVSAVAYPIFLDSANDVFLMDCRPTEKTGQEALDIILSGTPYTGFSDIAQRNTAYFVRRNAIDAINGNSDPTFIKRWGGEILYDNYKIIINHRVGGDYGVEARYGKNIEGVKYAVNMAKVVTRIVPVAYNGYTMTGDHVDSPHITAYPVVFTKEVKYDKIRMAEDAGSDENVIVCNNQAELDAALQAAAEADFAAGIDAPTVSLDVDMRVIQQKMETVEDILTDTTTDPITDTDGDNITTTFYRDYATLSRVLLGDTVHCRHKKLDITSTARVVEMTWDCLAKSVSKVVLGDYTYNYVSVVQEAVSRATKAIREDGSVIAEQVQGFIDGQNAQFRTQYDLATHQDTMAILFENLDESSPMYGALGIGTQGLCISKTRTADGRDWVWTTGATANGLNASMGVFGILADQQGLNYINLDTGEISFSGSAVMGGKSIEEMQTDTADAAKTATNYLYYSAATGLVISQTGEAGTGYNTQVTGDGINFRNGTTVMGSITGTDFTLYNPGTTNKAMKLDSGGLHFYKPDGTTESAKYTSNGLEVSYGQIGGFTIDTAIHSGTLGAANSVYISTGSTDSATIAGQTATGWAYTAGDTFGVTKGGAVYATSGRIGGWNMDATHLWSENFPSSTTPTAQNPRYMATIRRFPNSADTGVVAFGVYVDDGDTSKTESEKFQFMVRYNGHMTARNAVIKGDITAESGAIGNWVIGTNSIRKEAAGYKVSLSSPATITTTTKAFYVASMSGTTETAYPFYVQYNGEGKLGPWYFTGTAIYKGSSTMGDSTSGAAYFGNDGLSIKDKFKVTAAGYLTATGATVTGTITAESGTIGDISTKINVGLYTNSKVTAHSTKTGFLISKDGAIYLGAYSSSEGSCPFQVDSSGNLIARSATIKGTIIADAGQIGDWYLWDEEQSQATTSMLTGMNSNKNHLVRLTVPSADSDWIIQSSIKSGDTWTHPLSILANGVVNCADVRIYNGGTVLEDYGNYTPLKKILCNADGHGLYIYDYDPDNPHGYDKSILPIVIGTPTSGDIILGDSSYRFKEIWSVNGLNTPSDKTTKEDWKSFDERHEAAFMEMEPVHYKRKNGDRRHYGFLAQDLEAVFKKHGIDINEMGFMCIDDGKYSMRYEELIALNTHMIQKIIRGLRDGTVR